MGGGYDAETLATGEAIFGQHHARHVGKPQPTRRIVTGRRDCITGLFPSGKPAMGFRMVAYEGLIARDMIVLLEEDDDVVSYREEPPAIRWHDGVRWRTYTPDFAVVLQNTTCIAIEVGPLREKQAPATALKLIMIRPYAIDAGYYDFQIWTEVELDALRVANAALIASERGFVVSDSELHTMRVAVDRSGGKATVAELRIASKLGARGFRAVVALIARRELVLVHQHLPLDDRALVRTPA